MLSSLLKIEQQLQCGICSLMLTEATALGECEHRFCFDCISKKLLEVPECPTCKMPAKPGDLQRDHLHNNLVEYIDKIKKLSLNYTLTPMELSYQTNSSLYSTQELDDLTTKRKGAQDPTPRKKFAADKNTDKHLEDIKDQLSGGPKDITETEKSDDPEGQSTEQWKCLNCLFLNPAYIQTCGICHKYKNPPVTQNKNGQLTVHQTDVKSVYEQTIMDEYHMRNDSDIATQVKTRDPESRKTLEVHVMYTGLTAEDEGTLDKLINNTLDTKLKITIHYKMRDFSDVTHVITSVDKNKLCRRTLKYLQGILEGKWIMTPQWLVQSIQTQQWLPHDLYEVKGDHVTGPTQGPARGRDRIKYNKSPLFDNMKFYFFGDFSGKHNKNDLLALCRSGGGKILSRKPNGLNRRIDPETDPIDPKESIVITCTQTKKSKNAWLYESQVREPTWIIECISKLAIV
ncbi:hypothetical protein BY458DRAFT_509542 [Sporodiniella umbellata]|nr:hypothetical protein BY458DRAFT_509542 [Sporodiniella umbellata]